MRAADVATAPRVTHPRNQPCLEPGTAGGVAIERVERAFAAILGARRDVRQAREHQRQRVEIHGIHDDVVGSVPERGTDAASAGAHGSSARHGGLLAVHMLAEHALQPGIDPDATAVGATGAHADAAHQRRSVTGEIDGHEAAGREAQHDHTLRRALLLDHVPDQRDELVRLASRRRSRLEPVPAATDVVAPSLGRIEDKEVSPFRHLVEPGAEREVLGGLPAAVQRDDQGHLCPFRLRRIGRQGERAGHVETVQALPETALLERRLARIFLVRGHDHGGTGKGDHQRQRDQRPAAHLSAHGAAAPAAAPGSASRPTRRAA